MTLIFIMFFRWFGFPGHASPPAFTHQEPEQRDAGPPKEQLHGPLGTRSALHPLLLHALPTDGVGEPQRGAIQSHPTNREVMFESWFMKVYWETNERWFNSRVAPTLFLFPKRCRYLMLNVGQYRRTMLT